MASERAGRFRRQLTGYEAFMPKPLPPDPPLQWDTGLLRLLSDATAAVGRLDGMAGGLPNPDLFVAVVHPPRGGAQLPDRGHSVEPRRRAGP